MPIRIPCTKCGTPLAISRDLLDPVQGRDGRILCHQCGATTSLEQPAPATPGHEQESPEADEEFYDRPTLRVEPEALESEASRTSEPPLDSDPDNRITLARVSGPSGDEPGASLPDSAERGTPEEETPRDEARAPDSASSEAARDRPKDAVETSASDPLPMNRDVHEAAETSRHTQVVSSPSFRPHAEKSEARTEKWVLLALAAGVAVWCAFEGTSSRSEGPASTRSPGVASETVAAAAKPATHGPLERVEPDAGRHQETVERNTERPFDADAARASLNEAALAAATCRVRGDPPGRTDVVVTFDPSGQAKSARIYTGIYVHTNTARCIEKKMLEAQAPAFSASSVAVHHPVVVQ